MSLNEINLYFLLLALFWGVLAAVFFRKAWAKRTIYDTAMFGIYFIAFVTDAERCCSLEPNSEVTFAVIMLLTAVAIGSAIWESLKSRSW